MIVGKLLYFSLFLASLDPKYQNASETSRRGLVETRMMKDEIQALEGESEKILYQYTGLLKEDLAYAGYAYPVFVGKLSTKPFKNLKYETQNKWVFVPEAEYGLWNKSYSISVFLIKEF